MSEFLPPFELARPRTIDEAVALISDNADARVFAGGTDLMVNMRRGLVETGLLLDLQAIDSMKEIQQLDGGQTIGAGATLREIAENPLIGNDYPAIQQAALAIAGPTHRETATLGGNLCLDTRCLFYNQSHWWRKANDFCLKFQGDICHVAPKGIRCRAAFCGDLAPALMVHNATVEIAGQTGTRDVPIAEFYHEDGAEFLTLKPGEIVTAVRLAKTAAVSGYVKVRIRGAIDFPLAGAAIALERVSEDQFLFSVALTGTNSCPVMVLGLEKIAENDDLEPFFTGLEKAIQKTVSPQRTTTVAAHYRRLSIAAISVQLARQLWQQRHEIANGEII